MKVLGVTYRTLLLSIFLLVTGSFAMAQADHIEDFVPEYFAPEVYHGIDVSNHQGNIDWKTVAKDDNVQFVYIKATEGATYVSPTFKSNIKEARKAGMKVGCYHFLRATSYIHDQFKNFTEYCKEHEQDLAPLIDIEVKGRWTPEQLVDSLQLFADMLERHYKRKPVIYTSANFYNKYLSVQFSDYELFIAKYSEEEPILNDGTPYTLWQYTDGGAVNGIRTDVDKSRFNSGKSLNDILYHPVPRDPNVIAEVDMVKPIISLRMQTPSKFKTSRTGKIQKEQHKRENIKPTTKTKERPKRHNRSDISDEEDYMPATGGGVSTRSTKFSTLL